jgi:hypothetical protein
MASETPCRWLVWAATLVAGAFVSLPYALPNDFD